MDLGPETTREVVYRGGVEMNNFLFKVVRLSEEDENQLNFNLKNNKNHSYQGLFGNNGNHNRSKAASTKGHFPFNPPNDSIKGENVFKSKK